MAEPLYPQERWALKALREAQKNRRGAVTLRDISACLDDVHRECANSQTLRSLIEKGWAIRGLKPGTYLTTEQY